MSKLARTKATDLAIVPGLARTLRDVTRNCDADAPLASNDRRWQDFSSARGDDAVRGLLRELQYRRHGDFVHATFLGHRGAGKTTEVFRLIEKVSDAYAAVYIEATAEMDLFHIEVEDLLVNIVFAIERHLREVEKKPLPKDLLQRVDAWFDEVVRSTRWAKGFNAELSAGASAKAEVPFVGKLFGSVKALFKYESDHRTEVKQVLRRYPGTLLQAVNDVLGAANKLLGERALLVVVDNLDRYDSEVVDKLLVAEADRVRKLACNLLLTPPISLLLRPQSAPLDKLYSCHDLYMVRLRRPEQPYRHFDGPGRDLLEHALGLRIALDTVIPEVGARNRLIAASGGAIRELIDLVFQAALLAENDSVITQADVERAVAKRRQRIRDLVNANGWIEALRAIAHTKQISSDERCMAVLFHRLAFKYNGDGWYDVHPLVAELPEFQDERLALK